MKFILFDVGDVKQFNVKKINVCDDKSINEILFPKYILDFMNVSSQKILDKLRYKIYDKRINRIIVKSLDKHNTKWNYMFSEKAQQSDNYLTNKARTLLSELLFVCYIPSTDLFFTVTNGNPLSLRLNNTHCSFSSA